LIASLESNNFRNKGLTFTARYTLSGNHDNVSNSFQDAPQAAYQLGFTDSYDPDLDFGFADTDVRHRGVASFNYEPKWFQNGNNAIAKNLLGGWSLNGTVTMQSGSPFTIFDCTLRNAVCARLIPSGPVTINSTPTPTGDPNSFTLVNLSNQTLRVPAGGGGLITNYNFGPFPANMSKRNAFRGPGAWYTTMGIYKKIHFGERLSLQLRGEIFNVFNHPNMFVDYTSPDVSGRIGAGDVLSYKDGRRNVQLAAKLIF
jgi:hypothetical protein